MFFRTYKCKKKSLTNYFIELSRIGHAISVLLSYLRLTCPKAVSWGWHRCVLAFPHSCSAPAEKDRRAAIHRSEASDAIGEALRFVPA